MELRWRVERHFVGICADCPWRSGSQPSGEQAERLTIRHYRTEQPEHLTEVERLALRGGLVGAKEKPTIWSGRDLDEPTELEE